MDDLPLLLIGDKNLSSWSLRPWLLLAQAGISFREEVVLFDAPDFDARVRALSPTGKVPALVHGDLVLWESIAICEWVAERWPAARLWPDDPAARARARVVAAEMHAGFAAMRQELSMDMTRRLPTPDLSDAARADVERVQALWRDCFARRAPGSGPFLFGRFSVADAMFAPVCTRLVTYGIDVAADVREYVETILGLPAMQRWAADAAAEVAGTSPRGPRLVQVERPLSQGPEGPGAAGPVLPGPRTPGRAAAASTDAPLPSTRGTRLVQVERPADAAAHDGRVFTGAPWEAKVGYCRALRRGPLVTVSGTAPVEPDGRTHAPGDALAQARRCFAIALDALRRLGAGPEHVTRTRMLVTDARKWEAFGRAHAEAFGAHPPATTLVEVKGLISPDMLIEVEVDAWVG